MLLIFANRLILQGFCSLLKYQKEDPSRLITRSLRKKYANFFLALQSSQFLMQMTGHQRYNNLSAGLPKFMLRNASTGPHSCYYLKKK